MEAIQKVWDWSTQDERHIMLNNAGVHGIRPLLETSWDCLPATVRGLIRKAELVLERKAAEQAAYPIDS